MDGRAQVLLVDDEEDILASAKAYLQSALPVDVTTASSGLAGLAHLRAAAPDLIVSDYRMSGMDGLTFLTEVGRLLPDRPRILMTAYPDMQLAITALNEARISRFLTKPIDPSRLESEVRDLLESSRKARSREAALRRAANQR
jgi:DNA-binding NtrC family response regulator